MKERSSRVILIDGNRPTKFAGNIADGSKQRGRSRNIGFRNKFSSFEDRLGYIPGREGRIKIE